MDVKVLQSVLQEGELCLNEPMAEHTTFAIGGPVTLAIPGNINELKDLLKTLHAHHLRPFPLGCGSNLLVSDEGMDEVVVATERLKGIHFTGNIVTAEAGVTLKDLAEAACAKGLSGLEFASGIPGSLGGAIFMNAGAYDGEMCDVVISVDVIDFQGKEKLLMHDDLQFSYRDSLLKHQDLFCTAATFRLTPKDPAQIRERMCELEARRAEKQPLEDHSAGSTFKRPTGYYAGPLIIESGMQGVREGGARVSEKHAGFIVSDGTATAKDVLKLIARVKDAVYQTHGVMLECEVRPVGKPMQ